MMAFSYQVLLMVTFLVSVYCYPDGQNIDSACSDLTPKHGTTSQTTSAPFSVTFNPSTYTANQTVTVTLKSTDAGFMGFMIQARRADTNQNQELLGSFSVNPASTRQACSGKALVHSSSTVKSNLTINWIAPSTSVGNIIFRVTYVQSKAMFWSNRVSSVLVGSGCSAVTIGYFLMTLSAGLLLLVRP